ncbi:MAG: hypothetical protein HGB23_06920 [Chlorobiaceae bacterium]|nr:hypothetical protein [Chlorobiaceae bacterium]
MQTEFRIPNRIIGFCEASSDGNEEVPIVFREVVYSDEGDAFISRIESLQDALFSFIPAFPRASQIDNLLIIIRSDLSATAIVNELKPISKAYVKRAVKKGPAYYDDIVDIEELDLGEEIPAECGLVVLLSSGWRKVILFDFGPFLSPPQTRPYNLATKLGNIYSNLIFRDQHRITEASWAHMFKQGWFPFQFLPHLVLKNLVRRAAEGRDLSLVVDENAELTIAKSAIESVFLFDTPAFTEHRMLIDHAIHRFADRDYISVISILYPRLEGILRSILSVKGRSVGKLNQVIPNAATEIEKTVSPESLLLPTRFSKYLQSVLFRNWSQESGADHVSRHTVSHGVAPEALFDRCSATVAILTILQLGLYLKRQEHGNSWPTLS